MVRNEAPARAKAAGERQLPNDLSLPRQSSTLLAGRSGLVTKAVIAAQSLRISRASARTFSASSSRWSLQARFSRASIGLRMRAPVPSATSWIRPRISRSSHAPMWAPWGLRPPASAIPLRIRWARHLWRFLDQMGQTSLALLGSDGPDISGASWIRWARHLWPFLDQMGQTSLALLGSDGPDISGASWIRWAR